MYMTMQGDDNIGGSDNDMNTKFDDKGEDGLILEDDK